MGDMVIIPIAGNLFADFADTNIAVLNFILSGPALIGALSSLLCGKLMYYVNKKILLIIAFLCFMVGGIFGDVLHNPFFMAAMRALVGIGVGAIMVVSLAIISDVFIDEKARSSMVGIYNGLMAAVGALLGWVSGMVASIEWRLVFRIYLASIPILLLILLFIPAKTKAVGNTQEEEGSKDAEKMPWGKLLFLDAAFFIYSSVYCIVYYQVAMVIEDKGIGDLALIGIMSALGTVGSFVACSLFGLYYNRLKRFTPAIGFAVMAFSYWLLYGASGPAAACIACTLLGAMFGLGMSYYMMSCTVIVPPSQIPMAISITTTVMSIATFLSTYFSAGLQGIMGVSSITAIIPVLIVVLVIGAAVSSVGAIKNSVKEHGGNK
ncbi:MAG: MFS transporter [Treponema sp.]|nr:MFS transporter [Treponema sp.]